MTHREKQKDWYSITLVCENWVKCENKFKCSSCKGCPLSPCAFLHYRVTCSTWFNDRQHCVRATIKWFKGLMVLYLSLICLRHMCSKQSVQSIKTYFTQRSSVTVRQNCAQKVCQSLLMQRLHEYKPVVSNMCFRCGLVFALHLVMHENLVISWQNFCEQNDT